MIVWQVYLEIERSPASRRWDTKTGGEHIHRLFV
jgi:hypothetical protein